MVSLNVDHLGAVNIIKLSINLTWDIISKCATKYCISHPSMFLAGRHANHHLSTTAFIPLSGGMPSCWHASQHLEWHNLFNLQVCLRGYHPKLTPNRRWPYFCPKSQRRKWILKIDFINCHFAPPWIIPLPLFQVDGSENGHILVNKKEVLYFSYMKACFSSTRIFTKLSNFH